MFAKTHIHIKVVNITPVISFTQNESITIWCSILLCFQTTSFVKYWLLFWRKNWNGSKSIRIFEIWPVLLNSEGSIGHFLEIWYVWGHFFGLFKAYLLISRDIFVFKHILLPGNGPKSSQILNTVQFWPIQPHSNCSYSHFLEI